ncbi:transmembrane-type terpene cyclase [Nostoc sp.]|uniref:transmembrane-type terpene cyclase n=1 Tax=Nostoc sp. TaxID=1180 RepID=UPI003FA5671D
MNNLNIFNFLLLTGVGFGVITYILIIRQSFKDKTFGMPIIMACANLSGDFICSFIYPPGPLEKYINMFWLLFDITFIFLYLRYGKHEFFKKLPKQLFYPHFILILVFSYFTTICVVDSFFRESYSNAFKFIGLADNFIMSIMFCSMFLRRNNLEGQSVYIAFFKLLGSLCIAIAFCSFTQMSSILYLCVIGFCVFDFIYFVLVYQESQNLVLVYQESQKEDFILK